MRHCKAASVPNGSSLRFSDKSNVQSRLWFNAAPGPHRQTTRRPYKNVWFDPEDDKFVSITRLQMTRLCLRGQDERAEDAAMYDRHPPAAVMSFCPSQSGGLAEHAEHLGPVGQRHLADAQASGLVHENRREPVRRDRPISTATAAPPRQPESSPGDDPQSTTAGRVGRSWSRARRSRSPQPGSD